MEPLEHFLQEITAFETQLSRHSHSRFGSTGINVGQNIDYLLSKGSADHRQKVTRFLVWSQRASTLCGG